MIRDIDQEAYDRQRRVAHQDRVLQTVVLPAWADCWADVQLAARIERESHAAVAEVSRERAAAHRRLWTALDTLKGAGR